MRHLIAAILIIFWSESTEQISCSLHREVQSKTNSLSSIVYAGSHSGKKLKSQIFWKSVNLPQLSPKWHPWRQSIFWEILWTLQRTNLQSFPILHFPFLLLPFPMLFPSLSSFPLSPFLSHSPALPSRRSRTLYKSMSLGVL